MLWIGCQVIFTNTMNALLSTAVRFDIQMLAQAIVRSHSVDAFRAHLSASQWETLSSYMQPFEVALGQTLIEQGTTDRTLYFVEAGLLTVHYEDEKLRVRMATVGPGSVLGEGAFFSHLPRAATVQAATACRLWCLNPMRFTELSNRHSPIALEVVAGLGGVLAKRLYNRPKRVAVT